MGKGKLIIIESGSDASGKATQSQRLYERLNLLSQTLYCFKNSHSKKDITNCKYEEQKKIMEIISK